LYLAGTREVRLLHRHTASAVMDASAGMGRRTPEAGDGKGFPGEPGKATADRHIDCLLDSAGALAAVAGVFLDPLAVGVDVGDQVAKEAMLPPGLPHFRSCGGEQCAVEAAPLDGQELDEQAAALPWTWKRLLNSHAWHCHLDCC
jgi:hypothetical protein